MDASHRSLNVDTSTGGYFCFRCDTKGKLREYLSDAGETRTFIHTPPAKEPSDRKWKKWIVALAQPIRETEKGRNISKAGAYRSSWLKRQA